MARSYTYCLQVNLEDALDMLQYGDRNKDQKLSWEVSSVATGLQIV